ncbi:hypothetical protein L3Y34_012811 [Caenorhabditis briggsae]|uniref:Chromo domain-containing protein n=1 Tax=Caenorhabditis briggsae TaxID=6238 RepID=A0AAE8ZZZ7_CAEBR|nr:hypothetical protein L3Y34_012811 [Caenorhabditis briggsae]
MVNEKRKRTNSNGNDNRSRPRRHTSKIVRLDTSCPTQKLAKNKKKSAAQKTKLPREVWPIDKILAMKVEDGNFYFDVLWETGETTVEPMSSLRKLSHVKLQEFYQTNESIAKECFFEKYCWRKGHHEGKAENGKKNLQNGKRRKNQAYEEHFVDKVIEMKVENGKYWFTTLWGAGDVTVEPLWSFGQLTHIKLQEFYRANPEIAKECFLKKNASNREEELGNLRGQEQSDGDDEHQVMVEQPIVEENLLTKEIKVELDPNDIHMNEPTENRDNENAAVPLQTAHSVTAAGTYKVRPASAPPSFRGESKASGLQEFQVKKKYTHRIEEILRYEKKPAPKVEITMDVWNAILNDARFEVPFEIEPDSDSEDEIESDEEDDVDSDSDYDEDAFVDIMTLDGVPTVADLSGQLPSNDQVLRAFSKILNITAQ